jgi:hypothetical protein
MTAAASVVAPATPGGNPKGRLSRIVRWLETHIGRMALRRTVFIVAALVLGLLIDGHFLTAPAPAAHVLRFAILSTVSVAASQWLSWLVGSVVLSGVWLLLVLLDWHPLLGPRAVVGLLARNVGHLEAAFVWTALAACVPSWTLMFTMIVSVWAFGLAIARLLGNPLAKWASGILRLGPVTGGKRLAARRVVIAGFTLIGYSTLLLRAPHQWRALWPLFYTYTASNVVRLVVLGVITLRSRQKVQKGPSLADVRAMGMANRYDCPVTVALCAFVYGVRASAAPWTLADDKADIAHRAALASAPVAERAAGEGASLFIISDNQFHELTGKRSGVHLDLVDDVIPVAIRPVELDLLSGVTFRQFGDLYAWKKKSDKAWRDAPWAHLGDLADLGCRSELDRAQKYIDTFAGRAKGQPDDRLAALVPGNHDSTFFGNFLWHPDWETTCQPAGKPKEAPRTKEEVNEWIFDRMKHAREGADVERTSAEHDTNALVSFQVLGTIEKTVSVVGAFVDSSDYTEGVLGLAGVQGVISEAQAAKLRGALCEGGKYEKDEVVLFLHHPRSALSRASQQHLYGVADCIGDRLLALVSAHTHLAASRVWKERGVPEIVVGSILDPPQEASLLTISPEGGVRLETIPSVSRAAPEQGSVAVSLSECRDVYADLESQPDCHPLLHEPIDHSDPRSPHDLKEKQQLRAVRLLTCLGAMPPEASVVDDDSTCVNGAKSACPLASRDLYGMVDDKLALGDWSDKKVRRKLVCMARAASLLQGHKRSGWSFGRALARAGEEDDDVPMVVTCRPGWAECTSERAAP